jgi:hypothetical protein
VRADRPEPPSRPRLALLEPKVWFQFFLDRERPEGRQVFDPARNVAGSQPEPAKAMPSPTAMGGDGGGEMGARWSSSGRRGTWWWAVGGASEEGCGGKRQAAGGGEGES